MKTVSTRRAVTEGLLEAAAENPSVMLVSSDSTLVIKAQDFAQKYPERVMEVGISEQAAMAASAGLASCGMIPVYVSYAVFATLRACEQLRNTVAYPGLNVKIVGANGGMGSGEREGVTHQGLEDLGIVRTIPGLTVLSPSDANQVRRAAKEMINIPGPVYLRIGSGRDSVFWSEDEPFVFGKARDFHNSGKDVVIFSHGFVLPLVKKACLLLEKQGIGATATEVSTVKPLDEEGIVTRLRNCQMAIVVEDHTVIGGLGSAIAELAGEKVPRPVKRIGLNDQFSESGTPEELFDKYGITAKAIVEAVLTGLEIH